MRSLFTDEKVKPVFILGCARSGTTILGRALSHHPRVLFLNEPRHLWHAVFPEADIWSKPGKMVLTDNDVTPEKADSIRRLFADEVSRTGKSLLIEKLPINNFRLSFLNNIFRDARFIHIFRNGLEVARSMVNAGPWFVQRHNGWQMMKDYASLHIRTMDISMICSGEYERGLLEWRLASEAVHSFFRVLPMDRYTEILYDELISRPVETLNRLLTFLELEPSPEIDNFGRNEIVRKTSAISVSKLSEKEELIAGHLIRCYENKKRNANL